MKFYQKLLVLMLTITLTLAFTTACKKKQASKENFVSSKKIPPIGLSGVYAINDFIQLLWALKNSPPLFREHFLIFLPCQKIFHIYLP
jgi:hypothetical protein